MDKSKGLIELVIDPASPGRVLVAREFTYLGSDDELGICVRCSDETHSFHCFTIPTEREFYNIPVFDPARPFQQKRALVIDHTGFDEDQPPWAQLDRMGNVITDSDTESALENWLEQKVVDERLVSWDQGRHSEYGVAFPILDSLSEFEREALGIRMVDLGGPASSVPALTLEASAEQFNHLC